MRVTVQLDSGEETLADDALVVKAEDALAKALDGVQDGLGARTVAVGEGVYKGRGGEVRALGELGQAMHTSYQRRMDVMLTELAEMLEDDPRGQRHR